jgi:DNA repair protein RadC
MSADLQELTCLLGHRSAAAHLIISARALMEASLMEQPAGAPVASDDPAFLRYLSRAIGHHPVETLLAIYLDDQGRYLTDEAICRGTGGTVETRIRQIIKRCLFNDASSVILSHNHPSGDHRPSAADIRATATFRDVARAVDITLIDHIIVTPDKAFSMQVGGLLA